MKRQIKKSCKRCRAAGFRGTCELGYKVKKQWMSYPWQGIQDFSKPLEVCPKPKTIRESVQMSLGLIPGKVGTLYVKSKQASA